MGTAVNITDPTSAIQMKAQRGMSRKILGKIFNIENHKISDKIRAYLLHFLLFNDIYRLSYRRLKKWSQPFIILPHLLFIYSLPFSCTLVLNHYSNKYKFKLPIITSLTSLLLWFLFIYFLTKYNVNLKKTIKQKIKLWNKICKDINIDDRALHEVAGTWILPWAKNQPFDYFLDNG